MKQQKGMNAKGAVFQVSNAKWVAKVCLGVDVDGKPIIKQFSGKTEAITVKTTVSLYAIMSASQKRSMHMKQNKFDLVMDYIDANISQDVETIKKGIFNLIGYKTPLGLTKKQDDFYNITIDIVDNM